MPNLDGGHYFLTVLAPVRVDTMIDPVVGRSRSHLQVLAQKLSLLDTGRQTAASPPDAPPSPFAANTLNHLARLVIIDGLTFNGRLSGDTLVDLVKGIDPLQPQPVDELATPYLLFAAEVDATGDGPTTLRAYCSALWETMQQHLRAIFVHCKGFETVDSAAAFHDFILARQVETTMPFNDYWADGFPLNSQAAPPGVPSLMGLVKIVATGLAIALVLWCAAALLHGLLASFGDHSGFARAVALVFAWGEIAFLALIALALVAALLAYRWLLAGGAQPFPTAPGSDLPSVLKALFVQQHFTRFAIEAQGLDDAALHARFGDFLAAVRPAEPSPTQPPGHVRAPPLEPAP